MSSNLPPGCGQLPTEAEDWRETEIDAVIDILNWQCQTPGHYAAVRAMIPAIVSACEANSAWIASQTDDDD